MGLKEAMDALKARSAINWRGPIAEARAGFWRMMRDLESDAPAMQEVRPLEIGGAAGPLPARLYTPFAAGAPEGPGLVFFHGGGFVTGDLDSHDMICRRLADSGRVRVLSVAYRLAPEHKFPAAPDDALAATVWALDNAAALGFALGKIGVGGDSAGGNLAAVTTQALRKRVAAQMLVYPMTQLIQMTPSQIRQQEGFPLTQAAQDFFKDAYLPQRDAAFDVRVSPLLENDLFGLPPAYVVIAGFDPLHDEGKAYADKLAACGVGVTLRSYPKAVHGFFNMTAVSTGAKKAIADAGVWLSATLR
jgi:acetyl esterase